MLPAISASLPVWLCVSSEKPSSKLEGARLIPGASCTNRVGEAGACSAMFRWRMLCGVRTSHAQASVLAVAGIQLVMLVMLVAIGPHHPPTLDDEVQLDRGRLLLAAFALVMLIVCFTPAPIEPFVTGQ